MDHHSHFHHHRSSERHSGHLQCYRSRKVCVSSTRLHQYSEKGCKEQNTTSSPMASSMVSPTNAHIRNTATNVVPSSGNSSIKRNGGINTNSSSILNAKNGGNGKGVDVEQNRCGEARKANPNAVLANEKKAATQLGVIVGAFIICFLPYFTLFMVVAYCGNDQCVNPTVFTITIWFGYFNSTLNPILYPLCNANFKTAFKRMLRMDSAPGEGTKNEAYKNGVTFNNGAATCHPSPAVNNVKNHSVAPPVRQRKIY